VLPVQTDRTIDELTELIVANAATDSDLPPLPLSYTLMAINLADNSIIPNAFISAEGVISWLPTEIQGPSTNRFTTVVSDGNQSVANSFTVTVNEVNTAPALPSQPDRTLVGLKTLTVTNTASDDDIPANALSYSLTTTRLEDNSPVPNASIGANGIITWTPTVDQLGSTNRFITIVTDNSAGATNSFTVILRHANTTPALPVVPTQMVYELTPLAVTNSATTSSPDATLSYSLVSPPSGMSIDASGVIRWTPDSAQSPGTYIVTTIATATDLLDVDHPQLSATNNFMVVLNRMYLSISVDRAGSMVITWPAQSLGWTLQHTDSLRKTKWDNATNTISTDGNRYQVIILPKNGSEFFRLIHP
jgi:hypothetical protein